uniref:Titin n=1 Tax=Neolamprologus brichardi TaxID=32507 RepID=A0A3Q4N6M0_NEOBR
MWYRISKGLVKGNIFKSSGLEDGVAYEFRVMAENMAGIGKPSKASEPILALDPVDPPGQPVPISTGESVKVSEKPQPPGKITLKDVTKNSVTLSWEKPEHDGGSRVGCYVVEILPKGADKWTQALIVKETEATISGLNAGEEYMFRVAARNEKGTSDPRQIGVPVIVKDLVIAPAVKMLFNTFTVLAGEDLKVEVPYIARPKATVSWVKDGLPLKRTSRVNFGATDTMLNLTINEATKDDVGHYIITLTNTAGETKADIGIVVLDKPGQPDTTRTSVFLSWGKPISDGGCEIQGYIVECCSTTAEAPTKFEVANLKENQAYKFRVCAINKVGVGEHADVAGIVVAKDRADEPDLDIDPELRKIVTIKAGASLRLFIPIKGRPTPTIKWDKDEAPLKESAQVEITSSYTLLVIDKMSRNDSGKYTVSAENSSGTKSAFVVVRLSTSSGSLPRTVMVKAMVWIHLL